MWIKVLTVPNQEKATEPCFVLVPFMMLYKMMLTFNTTYEILIKLQTKYLICSSPFSFQPAVLDKLAHGMLHARHNYQRILLKYVSTLRDIHTLKKVMFSILQLVVLHVNSIK